MIRYLVLSINIFSGLFGDTGAWAQQTPMGANVLGGRCKGETTDNQAICSHDNLLKQGADVHKIRVLHAQKLLSLAEQDLAGPNATIPQKYLNDGTCLAGESAATCLSRLRRIAADASLNSRREILNAGEARRGLHNGVGQLAMPSPNTPPPSAPSGAKGVVADINKAVAIDAKTQAMQLLATPQNVSFTAPTAADSKIGDALLNSASIEKAKTLGEGENKYEAADVQGSDTTAVEKALREKQKSLRMAVESDQRESAKAVNQKAYDSKNNKTINDSVSAQALKDVMDRLNNTKNAAGVSTEESGITMGVSDVNMTKGPSGGAATNTVTTLDELIKVQMKGVNQDL